MTLQIIITTATRRGHSRYVATEEKTLKTYGSEENYDIYNFKVLRNGFQQQVSRNCLQRNNGSGVSFSDVGLVAGISCHDWSWSSFVCRF
jgi:hypothetical protein